MEKVGTSPSLRRPDYSEPRPPGSGFRACAQPLPGGRGSEKPARPSAATGKVVRDVVSLLYPLFVPKRVLLADVRGTLFAKKRLDEIRLAPLGIGSHAISAGARPFP